MKTTLRSLGLAAVLALAGAHLAAAQTALRFAHPVPESDPQHAMAVYFKEQLEDRSGGALTVQIFPQGQLGNDAQMIDGVRSGIIDITMVGLNNMTGLMPQASAFELPFMFADRASAYRALDGEPGQAIAAQFEQHGMKSLGFPENGFRQMSNNRGPIRTPADVSGLQMRVNNSRALGDMFSALGAAPQQLPVAELYTALETGVVDSQDHPVAIVLSFRFNEVQRYLSLTNHAYSPLSLAMNLNRFNGLSPELQQVVLDVAADAVAMQRDLAASREADMIAELKSSGMEVNEDVDSAAFQEATKAVWTGFTDANGTEIIDAILAAAKE
jgi:tripartite ATP-independent transporter DctP family solute receptor